MASGYSSNTIKSAAFTAAAALFIWCAAASAGSARGGQAEDSPLDLKSIPISNWLNAGEHADIPWDFRVNEAYLRLDQRLEISYVANISAKDLNRSGTVHELFFISRMSSLDGEWLQEPNITRHAIEEELPKGVQTQFAMRVSVQPGDYLLWLVLYDRKTGKHNVAKRRIHVPELRGDPLPDLYQRMPLVEFAQTDEADPDGPGFVHGQLYLPIRNKHPLQVELISTLSPPEQWTSRARVLRTQTDVTVGAMVALSQMELAEGTMSITGLDLVRREVLFEQDSVARIDWASFTEALKKAQTPEVSAKALQDSKNDGAFFREFLSERMASPASGGPVRVLIVVTSSQLFERGSDLTPLQVEGDCRCRVYHLRFRLNMGDVFDDIEKIIKPIHPRTYNLFTPRDLRKAIAEIVDDLSKL